MSIAIPTNVFYKGQEVSLHAQDIRDYLSSLKGEDTAGFSNHGYACLSAKTMLWKYGQDIDAYVEPERIVVANCDYELGASSFEIGTDVRAFTDPFDAWGDAGTPHTRDEVYEKFPDLRQPNA